MQQLDISVRLGTLNTRWIGDNLFCQANDSKESLNKRQPIDRRDSDVKQALNGSNPLFLFSEFLFFLRWDDMTNQLFFFFCCFSFKYYLIKFYFFCITCSTFPFMLKFVLVLCIHFKAFKEEASLSIHSRAQFPSSPKVGKFMGHASEIQSQIFSHPF